MQSIKIGDHVTHSDTGLVGQVVTLSSSPYSYPSAIVRLADDRGTLHRPAIEFEPVLLRSDKVTPISTHSGWRWR